MQRRNTIEESNDPLSKWIHWVDRAIEAAQERGDFDNLPGHGKPLMIDEHPYAGDRALGFHVLNNAGIKPLWMELDREIQHLRATMQALLDRLGTSRPLPEPITDAARAPNPGWRQLLTVRRGRPSAGSITSGSRQSSMKSFAFTIRLCPPSFVI
jgi:hypothetical protein